VPREGASEPLKSPKSLRVTVTQRNVSPLRAKINLVSIQSRETRDKENRSSALEKKNNKDSECPPGRAVVPIRSLKTIPSNSFDEPVKRVPLHKEKSG
jgi:hypothetical protein